MKNLTSDLWIPCSHAKVCGSILHGDLEFFLYPTLMTRRKNIFLHFFTQPKTYYLSYSIYIFKNFRLMSFDTADLKVTMPQDK